MVRDKLNYDVAGPSLIVWGAIWIVCFAITHFAPTISGLAWLVGDTIGIAASIYIGFKALGRPPSAATLPQNSAGNCCGFGSFSSYSATFGWP